MKLQKIFFAILSLLTFTINAQNLHDDANAAFPSNLLIADTNATTGWISGGGTSINSTSAAPYNGLYSVAILYGGSGATDNVAEYYFDVVNTETYNISIWVREGLMDTDNTGDHRPEFNNWTGLSGFTPTIITTGQTWTEYTFTVTATLTGQATIRVYTNIGAPGFSTDEVNIDSVSITHSSADTTSPSTITDLSSASVDATTLTLNWTVATDNVAVTDYGVFKDGALESLTSGINTYNVTGLTLGSSYDFTVYSIDAANNLSLVSNTLNVTTVDSSTPTTIVDLSSANITETSLDLNWTASTDNVAVTDYEVFQDGGSIGLTGGPNTFNVNGLTPNTSYDFTVFAEDAAGNTSLVSNTLNETTSTDITAPTAIVDLNSANITETSLDLNWTASTDNVAVTDYEVFQDGGSLGSTGDGAIITYNINSLSPNTAYAFTIFAKDAAGNTSLVSNTLNETTSTDVTAPTAIVDLSSANITETSLDLNWTASTDNVTVTDYEVFQDGGSIGLTGGPNTFNVNGLIPNTSYDFTIFAKDAAGNTSLVSNTLNESTSTDVNAPDAPMNLIASNITAFTANLSWDASISNDVIDYYVYQVGVGLIGSAFGATNYSVLDLNEQTSYDFYVTAIDASSNQSVNSNTVNILTLTQTSEIHYTDTNANLTTVDWSAKDIHAVGNVGIGTLPDPNYKLAIEGNVIAEEVRVALKANWPDYVFKKNYKLLSLKEVENYINTHGHLRDIPSAVETGQNGISLGEMNSKLLRKIEELTLYIIQQEKRVNKLSDENKELKLFSKRLLEIEKILKKLN